MVRSSSSDCTEEFNHVIDDLATDHSSDAEILHKALAHQGILDMPGLLNLSLSDFAGFDYDKAVKGESSCIVPLTKGSVGQLKTIKQCAHYSSQLGNTIKDWHTVIQDDCDTFKCGECNDDDTQVHNHTPILMVPPQLAVVQHPPHLSVRLVTLIAASNVTLICVLN